MQLDENELPQFYSYKTHLLVALAVVVIAALGLTAYFVSTSKSPIAVNVELQEYYPNDQAIATHYLEGTNSAHDQESRSVLWFDPSALRGETKYIMYNSAPEDPRYKTCNWDVLSWKSKEKQLVYSQTHNECDVSTDKPMTDMVYEPAITFLPSTWNSSKPWKYKGESEATYSENGMIRCLGTNSYIAEVLSYKVTNKQKGYHEIHWRTSQVIKWQAGPGSTYSGCRGGEVTRWQEDYYLTNDIEQADGPRIKGLHRSVGGNLETGFPDWDITFATWAKLPE